MKNVLRWAALSAVMACPALAVAQQSYSRLVAPNYGRVSDQPSYASPYRSRLAWNQSDSLPSPEATVDQVGSGLEAAASEVDLGTPLTIPQQGAVETTPLGDMTMAGAGSPCGADGCGQGCGDLVLDTGHAHGGWFGGLYFLTLFRDDDLRGNVLAYDDTDPNVPLLSTGVGHMKEANGLGIRVGKMFSPCTAIEGIYWQVFPDDVTGRLYSSLTPGAINSSLLFNGLDYDDGGGVLPVDSYFQGAQLLEVRRTYDYRNFELNFLKLPFLYGGGYGRCSMAVLAGVRYFRGDESFGFAADFDDDFLGNDPDRELLYENEVENHLVGFQLGAMLNLQMTSCLSGQIGSKFGIYNNRMNIRQAVVGGTGAATINSPGGTFDGQPFAVDSKKDDVAFLAELDAGLAYAIGCNWRVTGGYRVMAVSGYAQAISQIPYDFTDLSSAAFVQDHDSLILHGAYAGVEYCW